MKRYKTGLENRQKKTIPIGYNLLDDVCKGGRHGFVKIATFGGKRRLELIEDRSPYRKWEYYIIDYWPGKVLARSHSFDNIWKKAKRMKK